MRVRWLTDAIVAELQVLERLARAAACADRLHHVVAEHAALALRSVRDPQPCPAPEPGLAIAGATDRRQQRVRDHRARPHDLVDTRQLDLELDDRPGRLRIERSLEPKAQRRQVAQGRVTELIVGHDATQAVDRDARGVPAYVEEVHEYNRTRPCASGQKPVTGVCRSGLRANAAGARESFQRGLERTPAEAPASAQ